MTEACQNCRYWLGLGDGRPTGFCRRHAPRPVLARNEAPEGGRDGIRDAIASETVWPLTARDDWCGEYRSGPEHVPDPLRSRRAHFDVVG